MHGDTTQDTQKARTRYNRGYNRGPGLPHLCWTGKRPTDECMQLHQAALKHSHTRNTLTHADSSKKTAWGKLLGAAHFDYTLLAFAVPARCAVPPLCGCTLHALPCLHGSSELLHRAEGEMLCQCLKYCAWSLCKHSCTT